MDFGMFCCCQKSSAKGNSVSKLASIKSYEDTSFKRNGKHNGDTDDMTLKMKRIELSEEDDRMIYETMNLMNARISVGKVTLGDVKNVTSNIRLLLENCELTPDFCEKAGLQKFDSSTYKKLEKLGKGSFGVVWKCLEMTRRRLTAVKYTKLKAITESSARYDFIESFFTESMIMRLLGKSDTPVFPTFHGKYYDIDESGNVKELILVSEAGDFNLRELVSMRSRFKTPAYSAEEALPVIAHLVKGFKILKELGIYHSDTKLSNIVFSIWRGSFLIVDFGVSKVVPPRKTTDNEPIHVSLEDYGKDGTPSYFSPEKSEYASNNDLNREAFDPFKCDMWSLGICLERMIEGLPEEKVKGNKVLVKVLNGLKAKDIKERIDSDRAFQIFSEAGFYSKDVDFTKMEFKYFEELENKRQSEQSMEKLFERLKSANMNKEELVVAQKEYQLLVKEKGEIGPDSEEEFVPILQRLGVGYEDMGVYDKALETFILLNYIYSKHAENYEFENVAWVKFRMAYNMEKLGRNAEALEILKSELEEARKNSKESRKENVAYTLEKMAEISRNLGDHHGALADFEKVLDLKLKIYKTKDHPSVASTIAQIATQYSHLGDYNTALDLFQEVLVIQTKIFKTQEHPKVAATLCQIAAEFRNLGDNHQAMQILRDALHTQIKVYTTDEHPEVVTTLSLIAIQHGNLGSYQEALSAFEKVLEIQKKLYKNENHPEVVSTLAHIAGVNSNLGNHLLALKTYKEVLEMRKRLYGTEVHPEVAQTLGNIAEQIRDLGDHETALLKFQKVLEIEEKLYKTRKHPQVATTLAEIAGEYTNLGKFEPALEIFNSVIDIESEIYGTQEHPEVATTLSQVAFLYSKQGNHKKALAQFEKVLAIRNKCFKSQEHPKVLTTMELIADQHMALEQYESALSILNSVFDIQRRVYDTRDHPKIVVVWHKIAFCEENCGNLIKALELYQNINDMIRQEPNRLDSSGSLLSKVQRSISRLSKRL